jgi:hypothetical protein
MARTSNKRPAKTKIDRKTVTIRKTHMDFWKQETGKSEEEIRELLSYNHIYVGENSPALAEVRKAAKALQATLDKMADEAVKAGAPKETGVLLHAVNAKFAEWMDESYINTTIQADIVRDTVIGKGKALPPVPEADSGPTTSDTAQSMAF